MIAKKYLGKTKGVLLMVYFKEKYMRKRYEKQIGGMVDNEIDEGVM